MWENYCECIPTIPRYLSFEKNIHEVMSRFLYKNKEIIDIAENNILSWNYLFKWM